MRALCLVLVAALALLPLPALAGATALTTLNLRSGPGTAYPVIGVLRPGDGVAVAGCRPGWCFIQSRHGEGWASAGYLAGLVDRHRHEGVAPVVVDRVVVVERHRYKPVVRWPEPWNQPLYPPRRLPSPYPHPVSWPERFW